MADRKAKTTQLPKGGDYAYVADRLKEFRQDCPNGLIETKPTIADGNIIFQVRILKDKSKPNSAESTGHAFNKMGAPKIFEKTETQALGRALALLGYLASGEIASAEEMEEYYEYKNEQKEQAIASTIADMSMATTIEEVRKIGRESNLLNEPKVVEAGKKRVAELTAKELKNEDN